MLKYICVHDCVCGMISCGHQTLWELLECAWESLCDKCLNLPHLSACVITHKDGFWGERESLATKRQSKHLTGSHGNRGDTDKGMPRKATFRLQRKTLPFNLTRLSFAVSPIITEGGCRGIKMTVGWIIKSWLPWLVNSQRYACVCDWKWEWKLGGERDREV